MTLHRLEVVRGEPESAPKLVRHAVRLARRLRERRIDATFPLFIMSNEVCCRVSVGNRLVNLMNNGACHSSLLPWQRGSELQYDRQAMQAHHNRMHAIWMSMAANSRKMKWVIAARRDLELAREERIRAV